MEQVIKTYLGIFLMMLLSTVGIGIVAAEAQICQARNFKSDVVVELENSNYNREVINACIGNHGGGDIALRIPDGTISQ